MRACAFYRHQRVAHNRIMDDTSDRLTLDGHRQQGTESSKTRGKVERAVDGIDHEGKIRIGQRRHNGRIGIIGFFTDDMGIQIKPANGRRNALFRLDIRFRHQIDGRVFFGDRLAVGISETGKYFGCCGIAHGRNQEFNVFIKKGHKATFL